MAVDNGRYERFRHAPARDTGATSLAEVPKWSFVLLVLYVSTEFIRPQDVVPVLGVIRPALLLAVALTFVWLRQWGIRAMFSDRLIIYFGLLTLLVTAWVPFAVNNFWAFQTSKSLVMLLAATVVPIAFILQASGWRKKFFVFWMLAHLYIAAYAMTHAGRGSGSFLRDENDMALALCMALPYPYFIAQARSTTVKMKVLCWAMIIALLGGIAATTSRGGFVALLCVSAYILWIAKNKLRNIVIVILLGIVAVQFVPAEYARRIETITDTENGSRNERLLSWRIGWEMFLDNPVVGVGPSNWPFHAGRVQMALPDYRPGDQVLAGRAAHSLWFTLLPELGVVGTVLFLLILWEIMKRLKRSEKLLARLEAQPYAGLHEDLMLTFAMRASLVAYLAGGTFLSVLYHPHVPYLIGFVIALSRDVDARIAAAGLAVPPPNVAPTTPAPSVLASNGQPTPSSVRSPRTNTKLAK
jgi:O-antigen ligase